MSSRCMPAVGANSAAKSTRRLAAADMEFVGGGEIVGRELVEILAGGDQAREQRLFQRAVAVMRDDVLFDGHGGPGLAAKMVHAAHGMLAGGTAFAHKPGRARRRGSNMFDRLKKADRGAGAEGLAHRRG